jgi:hypothetical protein
MLHYYGSIREVILFHDHATVTSIPLIFAILFVENHALRSFITFPKIFVPLLPVAARNLSDHPNSVRKLPRIVRCSLVEIAGPFL